MATRKIEQKGVKKVKINTAGKEKESHTVLLGASLTLKKLPASIIIKSKGVKLILGTPRDVRLHTEQKGLGWILNKFGTTLKRSSSTG